MTEKHSSKLQQPIAPDAAAAGAPEGGRREFLRKAIYTTPVLLALGQALHSDNANAQCDPVFGCPPSLDPGP